MAIKSSQKKFELEFPNAYSKAMWININGHNGFSCEVEQHTWKDAEARAGKQVTTKDEDGKDVVSPVSFEPIDKSHIVLSQTPENKADIDRIRAIVYGMLMREQRFAKGKSC